MDTHTIFDASVAVNLHGSCRDDVFAGVLLGKNLAGGANAVVLETFCRAARFVKPEK